ncbi:MAG: Na+/H+ antiporter subunit B [Paracoccus sp. (in: a-proteobacteria)]|nr:Na+/H+ antiporter subunit B [Paracoccus sp. (in: a-proteobacteria)]
MKSLILSAGTRYLVGLLIVFSIYMLMRGHNEPGGGFVGGLIGAVGFVLYALSSGTEAARKALRFQPESIAIVGLLCALVAGLIPALFGDVFFTGQWWYTGPGGDDKGFVLSTVLLFDIGVYLAVFGSILALIFALEEFV